MGIIAYGKLGGNELHYESDLDIIFLHNSEGRKQETRGDAEGKRVIDNATFFARLAQKVISKVTLLTAGGKLYEIDTRLRPDGASGLLVSALSGYRQYQLDKAWVWEHQAIIRARFIAGDRGIIEQFESIRAEVLLQQRDPADLADEIQSMRERMYEAKNPAEGTQVNLKHSRGCMVDIEFMVQYLVLRHANKFASLTQTTDNIGLINELSELGLVDRDFRQLASIYQTFHEWLHRRVLQNQPDEIDAASIQSGIDTVKDHWNRLFGNTGKHGE